MISALVSMPSMSAKAMISVLAPVIETKMQEELYREYLADALFCIGQNTSGASGVHMTKRYHFIVHPEDEDTRTGDEIALEVIERMGLRLDDGSA